MPITLRTAEDMVAEMIATTRGQTTALTDMNVGSVGRTIYEATAVEIERLFQYMLLAIDDAGIARTAMSIFEGAPPLDAQPAYGEITITAAAAPNASYTFPAGTLVKTADGKQSYAFVSQVVYPAGVLAVDGVLVTAQTTGGDGNVAAGTINQFVGSFPVPGQAGINFAVTNPRAFVTGLDAETSVQRLQRFQAFLRGLHRGDAESIEVGARTTTLTDASGYVVEKADLAQVADVARGFTNCYICTYAGSPSQALINACQKVIDGYVDSGSNRVPGYKAAGITCTVLAATLTAVDLDYSVDPADSVSLTSIKADIEQQIQLAFAKLDIGDPLRVEYLDDVILGVAGVLDVKRNSPTANQPATVGVRYIPGTIKLTSSVL